MKKLLCICLVFMGLSVTPVFANDEIELIRIENFDLNYDEIIDNNTYNLIKSTVGPVKLLLVTEKFDYKLIMKELSILDEFDEEGYFKAYKDIDKNQKTLDKYSSKVEKHQTKLNKQYLNSLPFEYEIVSMSILHRL